MLTKKALIIAAAALAVGAVAVYARRAQPPKCGPKAKWHVATDFQREFYANKTGATAESIRKFGGYCGIAGNVSDPYVGGDVDEGSYLITQPSQLG